MLWRMITVGDGRGLLMDFCLLYLYFCEYFLWDCASLDGEKKPGMLIIVGMEQITD